MLVENNGIEAQAIGENQLLKVLLVEFVSLFRIVELVWEVYPGGLVVLVVFRQMHKRHEVHHIKSNTCAHCGLPQCRIVGSGEGSLQRGEWKRRLDTESLQEKRYAPAGNWKSDKSCIGKSKNGKLKLDGMGLCGLSILRFPLLDFPMQDSSDFQFPL